MMGINDPKCGRVRRSDIVTKLKRMIYGQKDAGRAWMQLLDKFFHSINAKPTVTDPAVYNWSFNGHTIGGFNARTPLPPEPGFTRMILP